MAQYYICQLEKIDFTDTLKFYEPESFDNILSARCLKSYAALARVVPTKPMILSINKPMVPIPFLANFTLNK